VLLGLRDAGELTIVDHDFVDVSNLQRQILHRTTDVGRPKSESARDALLRRQPGLSIHAVVTRLDSGNVQELIAGHDLVVDGTDSFETKFLLNDSCLSLGVPLIHGAVVGWIGQLMTVRTGHACYRCIFEQPPALGSAPSCQQAGILGAVAGVIAGRMAREALACLAGKPELSGTMLRFDARRLTWRHIAPRPRPDCAAHERLEVASC
jgi:molybdopterin/thiamine biosynthesis adenylyltransferase